MRRRCLLSAAAASAILLASQAVGQEAVRRVGVLTGADLSADSTKAWAEGLRERGYVVGRNLHVEYRFTEGRAERIPALAAELIALRPEVIVAASPAPAVAIKAAAPIIPLVFVAVADPVGLGLVASLARPGGNVTGLATIVPEGFNGKSLHLLKELVPQASRIAVLENPTNPMHRRLRVEYPEIGRLLGVTLFVVEASQPDQLASAFDAASKQGAEAIAVAGDPMSFVRSAEIVALVARHRLPAIYFFRKSAVDGGLLSFGPDLVGPWRTAGGYVGRILNGERPADLPVEQPTKYELVVNLKTAGALGITVPPSILAQADEVIE
jgi:putative ABC transport system substrate-binding protein